MNEINYDLFKIYETFNELERNPRKGFSAINYKNISMAPFLFIKGVNDVDAIVGYYPVYRYNDNEYQIHCVSTYEMHYDNFLESNAIYSLSIYDTDMYPNKNELIKAAKNIRGESIECFIAIPNNSLKYLILEAGNSEYLAYNLKISNPFTDFVFYTSSISFIHMLSHNTNIDADVKAQLYTELDGLRLLEE